MKEYEVVVDEKVRKFLEENKDLELAEEMLDSIKEGSVSVYWGDFTCGTEPYFIILTSLYDIGANVEIINSIAEDMIHPLQDAVPVLDRLDNFPIEQREEIIKKVESQAKDYNCDPKEIMINGSGADDSHLDLEACSEYVFAILEILERIDTRTAKTYIDLIEDNHILDDAMSTPIFYW